MEKTIKNDTCALIKMYVGITIRSWFQYKIDAILRSTAVFLREATGIIVIYFSLLKFDSLNGWNMKETLFLFSLMFLTYGILIIFFTGLRDFGMYIRDGRFDRFLLRPRGELFQVIMSNSDWFAAIGHGLLGIALFIYTASDIGIIWNLKTVGYYIMAVVGGVLIQGGIFLILAALNFYLINTSNLKSVFYWNLRKFMGYPISIFHEAIQCLLIYIVPLAFVNYFPAQYFLRKSDMSFYPEVFIYVTPVVGAGVYLLAYGFWRISLRYYKSTGN